MLPRGITSALDEAMKDTPVVCLLGPRQCGKSTLARSLDPARQYLSLDDANLLAAAIKDPGGFISQFPDNVTLDEVQRAPELLLAIKRAVDEKRRPGRFLLTGSANLLQLPHLPDSLAGRMECLYLHPLSEAEKSRGSREFPRPHACQRLGGSFSAGRIHGTVQPARAHCFRWLSGTAGPWLRAGPAMASAVSPRRDRPRCP